jgi:hypothetical protein
VLRRVIHAVLLSVPVAALSACTAAAPRADDPAVVAAVIVMPRVAATSAEVEQAAQATLGRAAGVLYVRPLAGDAHLIQLTAPATARQVPELIERLRASGAYQFVEADSMMKRQ